VSEIKKKIILSFILLLMLGKLIVQLLPAGLFQIARRGWTGWGITQLKDFVIGQDKPAAVARLIVSSTVVLPTPQVFAV
jgi:hypothetical protein